MIGRRAYAIATFGSLAIALWLAGYAVIYLPSSLPHHYLAAHWRVLWVGFDLVMAATAIATFWLLRRRSIVAVAPAAALVALLLCDAWFDCLTAQPGDLKQSLVSLCGELPAALFFTWIVAGLLRAATGHDAP